MARQDVSEEVLPAGKVALERHLHDLAVADDAADVLPPERIDVILVFRVDRGLPGELPVLARDLNAVAPSGVLADVVRDPLWVLLEGVPADQIVLIRELGREQERAANHRRLEHHVPERVAIHVQDQVQAPVRTAALLRPEDQRAARGGTFRSTHSRRAVCRQRKRCQRHPGQEPELPSMHLSLLVRPRSASRNAQTSSSPA